MRLPKSLRCYAVPIENEQWKAVCLELCLATQGDSFDEAKRKLESMIESYIDDVLTEDREFARQLLKRRAPFGDWLTYYVLAVLSHFRAPRDGNRGTSFLEQVPIHC